jgi:leucyl-tRNA synthetase
MVSREQTEGKRDFQSLEKKWQKRWEEAGIFKVSEDSKKKKFYVLEMFPYPSAAGLHMGHIRNYSMGDAFARFRRMQGFNVLYPMGYDAFGLPAENAAIKNKIPPGKYTKDAIEGIKKNQKSLGLSYDWTRELATCCPEYYKWNQWFFLQMLKKGLAYKKESPVNWCPKCETVLANEQVENGKCWRCGSEVTSRSIEQWFFKITKYADELLEDLDRLEWPEKIKTMQENWIGKSRGVDIFFRLHGPGKILPTFTTRCDTVFSVTFLAIAPEHPLIEELVKGTKYEKSAKQFIMKMKRQSIEDRVNEEKEKEGFFIGKYAINPVNKEKIPIYIANFAVMYGSGIVMCDAHDRRDFRFARKYKIPLKFVISRDGKPIDPKDFDGAFTEDGVLFNSGKFSGMRNTEALPKMANWLQEKGFGKKVVNYKLRDWGISRQRYWGTPIPIIYCEKCGTVPVPEKDLPVILPSDVEFTGHGNPLEKSKSFVEAVCPKCGSRARRETDTMDTFVDSSWYFLRFCSPHEKDFAFDRKAVKYWMPVDQYIGGAEHAVMHLLYARFFTMVLRDLGLIGFGEPFTRLFNQGIVYKDGHKMSKSFGNVVTQEEVGGEYGIDTARIFLLFVASPDSQLEWSDEGVTGAFRFLNRLNSLAEDSLKIKGRSGSTNADRQIISKMHKAIKSVTDNMEGFRFNAAIGSLMAYLNDIQKYREDPNRKVLEEAIETLLVMLSPFAPHTAEELWERTGHKDFVSLHKWPRPDEGKIDPKLDIMDGLVEQTREDIRNVIKLVGKKPERIRIYVSPLWKYAVYESILEMAKTPEKIVPNVMKSPEGRKYGSHALRLAQNLAKNAMALKRVLSQEEEFSGLSEGKAMLEKEFGCRIEVLKADTERSERALRAEPGKPGIEVI